jgi:hypothetical protein
VNDKTLEELLEDWKEERISAREAIDQLLRHHLLLLEHVRTLERGMRASPAPAPTRPAARPGRASAKRR